MFNSLIKREARVPAVNSFDNLVDDLLNEFVREPDWAFNRNWTPTRFDKTDKEYVTEIELPRFKKEEIKVSSENGRVIRVSAEINRENYKRRFEQTYHYPDGQVDNAQVELQDGVLSIKVPRAKKEQKILEVKLPPA